MSINKLAHISVRTVTLEASRRFYCDVLGLKEGFRPPFEFPGIWLYYGNGSPSDESNEDYGVIHLVGIDENNPSSVSDYLGEKAGDSLQGSGAVDHIAFEATNLSAMHRKLNDAGLAYRERTVPQLGLHQVFVEDPSGITIELNYPADEIASLNGESSVEAPLIEEKR